MEKPVRRVFRARKMQNRQPVTVSLQPTVVQELDMIAKRCHRSRSNLIALFVDLALAAICIAEAKDI